MKLMPKWFKKAESAVAHEPVAASAIAPLPVMGGQIISPSASQATSPAPVGPPQGEHDNYALPSPVTAAAPLQPIAAAPQPAVTKIPVQIGADVPSAATVSSQTAVAVSTPPATSPDQHSLGAMAIGPAPAAAQPTATTSPSADIGAPATGQPQAGAAVLSGGGMVDPLAKQHSQYQTENPLAALGGNPSAGSKT